MERGTKGLGQAIEMKQGRLKEAADRSGGNAFARGFAIKKQVGCLLASSDFEQRLETLGIAPAKIISPLLGFLMETDEPARWRAVRSVGLTVSAMAKQDLESARDIMRRLMWSLNDESGGIGWGAPEAMGEIMAENGNLAREYHRILVSYIDPNGNPIENELLEQGVMWGICRLAQKRPMLLRDWTDPVIMQLKSPNPVKRGLALRILLILSQTPENLPEPGRISPLLQPLPADVCELCTYEEGAFVRYKISAMAKELMGWIDYFGRL
ncbi:MAG: DVU0298 family protein [Syntrophobacteraceae bacterium]